MAKQKLSNFEFFKKICLGYGIILALTVYTSISISQENQNQLDEQIYYLPLANKENLKITNHYGGGYKGGGIKVWGYIINSSNKSIYEVDITKRKNYNIEIDSLIPIWVSNNYKLVILRVFDDKQKNINFIKMEYEIGSCKTIKVMIFMSSIFVCLTLITLYLKN